MDRHEVHLRYCLPICFLTAAMACLPAFSATVYNEAISGDLSNNGLAPTALSVTEGSNQVFGTTGNHGGGIDRDYFTINVPRGYQIGQLVELAGTQVGANVSFIGLEAGPQLTVPPNAQSAAGLLGWDHYSPRTSDIDLLSTISIPSNGSSGFSALPSGQYSFWIQDFNSGTFAYAFDIRLTPTPEPGTYATSLVVLMVLGVVTRKRSHLNK